MKAIVEEGARAFVLTMTAAATWESSYAPAAGYLANEVRLRQAIGDARIACNRMERLLNAELSAGSFAALAASELVTKCTGFQPLNAAEAEAFAELATVPVDVPAELRPQAKQLVRMFAEAMARKMRAAEVKHGWNDDWLIDLSAEKCRSDFAEHIGKGDPRDVAIYCAFMWARGWSANAVTPRHADALRAAIRHIEHMAAWIGKQRQGHCYSFEGLGEDMPDIRAAALGLAQGAPVTTELLESVGIAIAGELTRQHGADAWDNLGDGESLFWHGAEPPAVNVVELAEALARQFLAPLPPVLGLAPGALTTRREAHNVVTLVTSAPAPSDPDPDSVLFFTMDGEPGFYIRPCAFTHLSAAMVAGMFLCDPAKVTAEQREEAGDVAATVAEFGSFVWEDGSVTLRRGVVNVAAYLYAKVIECKTDEREADGRRFDEMKRREAAEARFELLRHVLMDALGVNASAVATAAAAAGDAR